MTNIEKKRTTDIQLADKIKKLRRKPFCTKCGGLYRWWFPIDCEICSYILRNYDNSKQHKSLKELLPRLKTKLIEGQKCVALYVGQSDNLTNRFSQHIATTTYHSTLRKTLAAIFLENGTEYLQLEKKVSEFLKTCYFEWVDFPEDAELIETIEALVIAAGCYPLNLDANRSISKDWINHVMKLRKQIKN